MKRLTAAVLALLLPWLGVALGLGVAGFTAGVFSVMM